ncbi:SRPBCC family protein [Maricaulis sp. CAU 1757]
MAGPSRSASLWVAARLLILLAGLVAFGAAFYALANQRVPDDPVVEGMAVGYAMLICLPFSLGALIGFALDPSGKKTAFPGLLAGALAVLAVLFLVGCLMAEGLICMVMLAPLWVFSAWAGSFAVWLLHERFRNRVARNCLGLLALPVLALFLDPGLPSPSQTFEVRRAIEINAAPSEIWPHLLKLDDLSEDEGVWNVAQEWLRIPRPRSAVISGEGVGAVREARWGDDIRFEEVVSTWVPAQYLAWRFRFPDNSLAEHTDAHIGPRSQYLSIESGGYEIEPLPDGRSRLILNTRYIATSPVNHYSALWGELFLGDIQRNILHIIRDRAEAHPVPPAIPS